MRKLVLVAALVLMAGGAQAATLNVIGGQLLGASNVLVDGSLYDVQFLDGTCETLYTGCDETSDFTFQTHASAILAAQALLDQVFLDGLQGSFDSVPSLTNGCESQFVCSALTPWDTFFPTVGPPGRQFLSSQAVNVAPGAEGSDDVSASLEFGTAIIEDLTNIDGHVLAIWSPIPEPSTALLLGLGLTGLAAKGRRRSRS